MRKYILLLACYWIISKSYALDGKTFEIRSPDGSTIAHVHLGDKIEWSVDHKGQKMITPSVLSLELTGGEVLGKSPKILSSQLQNIVTDFPAINYKKSIIKDRCTQFTVKCKGDYSLIFRIYNDAVAYRFVTSRKGDLFIRNEEANFNFAADDSIFAPIQNDYRGGKNFNSSFEALYHELPMSKFPKDSLAFLPVLANVGQGMKVVILEADLQDYPGMYLNLNETKQGFKGVYAPYPLDGEMKGINFITGKNADYIAKVPGTCHFPWRAIVISDQDKDLLNQDLVQKLAEPSRLTDVSWIKPGQVAWDWWNNWNITHVDFKAGINTATYKYYIDFAAANGLAYAIMDEGWSSDFDLLKIASSIDLQQIVNYGNSKGVGIILWATWHTIVQQMDSVFPHFAAMGVKGFKIDFIDRDDQIAIASTYSIAKLAAQYKLLVDYHGTSKPAGLQRTYPNVVGYEGVKGLENFKWGNENQPHYVATIPFIRMMAGPMDYTPGAMRNATQSAYRPINENPMSKGTRCQQLAEYVVFEAPLQMLSDNPTTYLKEKECAHFITSIPTTFEETIALDGEVGGFAAIARRKGNSWYVGALTDWIPRTITIDFSFLPAGNFKCELYKDGINADRDATDYKTETIPVKSTDKLSVQLFGGGGWAARIYPG